MGLVGGLERGVVRERWVATDSVVILHPTDRRQAVVIPTHRVEDGFTAHALVAGDRVRVGIAKDVADVERARHRWRRGIDGEDLRPLTGPVEAVDAVRV